MSDLKLPTAADIMSRSLHTILADDDLEDAIRMLLKRGFSGAPVLDASGTLVGVLTEHDLVSSLAAAATDRWPLGRVADHMTREMVTVSPSDDVFTLAARFSKGHQRRLLVVSEDRLVGLVSRRDLVRSLDRLEKRAEKRKRSSTLDILEQRHIKLD